LGDVTIHDGSGFYIIPDVDQLTLSMNTQMVTKRNLVFPTWVHGQSVSPSIQVRTYDISIWDQWNDAFGHIASGGIGSINLHAFNMQSGQRTGVKMILQFKVADTGIDSFGGDNSAEASGNITITPLFNGVDDPITFSAAA
jgi:hypothetical protein